MRLLEIASDGGLQRGEWDRRLFNWSVGIQQLEGNEQHTGCTTLGGWTASSIIHLGDFVVAGRQSVWVSLLGLLLSIGEQHFQIGSRAKRRKSIICVGRERKCGAEGSALTYHERGLRVLCWRGRVHDVILKQDELSNMGKRLDHWKSDNP